ncbi:MAG TPA: C39 family peptidase [Ktedonobacterales bacterium]|nr:C39 family peptidase [Ktedonobacterales bacterium]
MPGARRAWRIFWRNVEHPRLVQGGMLLFPALALLTVLAHLALAETPGLRRPGPASPPPVPSHAASQVQAFYQGDPGIGWDSRAQYETWWPSACSPAALSMDLRAWGVPVRIGQVLDRLIAQHAITPQQGLLHAEALATVAKGYGLHTETFWTWTLADVAQVTRQGVPVLVNVVDAKQQTPYPGFVVGHWLVVTGVSATAVQVADSSGYHIHSLSPALFRLLATGIGVVVWRGTLTLPREG